MEEDGILAELAARITALEDKVDNQLIGGLKKAKEQYDYEVAFDDFSNKYKDQISVIDEGMKRASGDPEYDICKEMFDAIRTVDGYSEGTLDVAKMIADKIEELAYRYNIPIEVEVDEEAAKDADEAKEDDKSEAETEVDAVPAAEEVEEAKKADEAKKDEEKPLTEEDIDRIAKSVGL